MSEPLIQAEALLGRWVLDPTDTEAREVYGDLTVEFGPDGRLTYSVVDRGKLHIRRLEYRLEAGELVSGRPGDPAWQRSRAALLPDGRLKLTTGGQEAAFQRAE